MTSPQETQHRVTPAKLRAHPAKAIARSRAEGSTISI